LGGIHGILASDGQFQGTLESIAVEGTTEIPDFAVRGSSHRLGLKSQFRAKVDAMNGDVMLDKVSAQLMKTRVLASGSVASKEHEHGKTASLDLAVQGGRIEDLLLLFVSAKRAPLTGTISLKAKAEAPPGNEPFLKKLAMTGNFGIEGALFTKKRTQEDLDKLSAAAQGKKDQPDDAESAISDLQGHVVVRDGVATFSDLSFRVPGALARLHGTFDLTTERVNLRGVLLMQSNLPQATSGIKSFLLKAIDPFLKKNRRGGARIPITITGTYEHPVYKSDPV
jgi:AsmA-like protein